jgi:pseudouridine-5'-phosphate glycosidase
MMNSTMDGSIVSLGRDVKAALADSRPVVALESTLIAHGLPWPVNLATAHEAHVAVREEGAVPAVAAILGGVPRLGIEDDALEQIASSGAFLKATRRDLPMVMARALDAATTVSATLFLARSSGIRVMATGGLGGVHRGAAKSFDISADLDELARADGTLLVCSGAKSILDLPATLESLETLGVAVVGYRTSQWPAFTTVSSGLPLEWAAESVDDVARLVRAHRALALPGALVLAQPVAESLAIEHSEMQRIVDQANAEAQARGIGGKALTPFLLDAVREATAGRSLEANKALAVSNARLAAQVAVALSRR